MRNLKSRLGRLEKAVGPAPDQARPMPPRAAGKPRSVAIVEYIDYLQILASHTSLTECERRQCETAIERCEVALGGQTREQVFEDYAAYLRSQLDSEWGSGPRGREYLLRTLDGCQKRLAAHGTLGD